ncbi:MAG: enoyl-CoA hydratase family protein [Planctomycetes bacterium]|nr:enoyl-CoA hydratase family protein [Planctomycetota bacterium]MCB9884156.1 enoyl-CoA hydratase family protein [Planctomycetota bacterium]
MRDYDFRFERNSDGVAVLTLDRPETLNSLTFDIYGQLERLFLDLENDDSVKVVVLTGQGRGFCSGGSVEDIIGPLLESELDDTLAFTRMTGAVVRNMLRLSKPIVAAINGVAAGAGAVLALASDFRVMAAHAKFAFLFTRVGLTGADMGAAWLLPKIVGTGRAMELLMLGDKVTAGEALAMGLANRVVDGDVLPEAMALARRLAAGPGLALAMTKKMVWNEWPMDLEAAIEQEAQAQALLLRAHDHREFYNAWMEKRDPRFLGR